MKVIICGAGQVGANIARYLMGSTNDITLIDRSYQVIGRIANTMDVRGIVGHAAYPDILEKAGAADADLLLAVTRDDEVNMVTCEVAEALFKVPTKIARIRQQNYMDPAWSNLFSRENIPIDVVISPEKEVARSIVRNIEVPTTFDVIRLADDKVRVLGLRCYDDCPLINTPLRQLTSLFPDLNITIIGIARGDQFIVPHSHDQMLAGDDVYCVCDTRHIHRVLLAFGHKYEPIRRIVIVGGGHVGLNLVKELSGSDNNYDIKLVELDSRRARLIAQDFPRVQVFEGDILDSEIIEACDFGHTNATITVTDSDEINTLGAMLAKQHGSKETLSLVNNDAFHALSASMGIDAIVNPRAITVSGILQHIRRGRILSAYSLREGFGEILEAEALATSPIVGTALNEINLPEGIIIGAIVRHDEVIIPRGATVIEPNDRVILHATPDAVKTVERLFAVRLEFF